MIGRVAAVAAVVLAVVVVAVILLSGGSSYQVNAVFQDASQIVSGDQVEVAGNTVGTVSKIALTPNGQAQLTLSINNSSYTPLHQGTEATVRLSSLSGIANRYVDLRLGPANAPKIPSRTGSSRPPTRPARSTSTSCSTRSTRRRSRASRT